MNETNRGDVHENAHDHTHADDHAHVHDYESSSVSVQSQELSVKAAAYFNQSFDRLGIGWDPLPSLQVQKEVPVPITAPCLSEQQQQQQSQQSPRTVRGCFGDSDRNNNSNSNSNNNSNSDRQLNDIRQRREAARLKYQEIKSKSKVSTPSSTLSSISSISSINLPNDAILGVDIDFARNSSNNNKNKNNNDNCNSNSLESDEIVNGSIGHRSKGRSRSRSQMLTTGKKQNSDHDETTSVSGIAELSLHDNDNIVEKEHTSSNNSDNYDASDAIRFETILF
jgi:hypothetical protein